MHIQVHIATFASAFVTVSLLLQGCEVQNNLASSDSAGTANAGNESSQSDVIQIELQRVHELESEIESLGSKVKTLEGQKAQECKNTCDDRKLYGRWRNAVYSHSCWDSAGELICLCTSSKEAPEECSKDAQSGSLAETSSIQVADVDEGLEHQSAMDKLDAMIASTESEVFGTSTTQNPEVFPVESPALLQSAANTEGVSASGESVTVGENVLQTVHAHEQASDEADASEPPLPGSVRQIVGDFCDADGLKEMQGKKESASDSDALESVEGETNEDSSANQLESAILADVANELETNNVDKMAKEIFTFYMCVRWVPDKTFFELAQQELAASIVSSMVDHQEKPDQAIAELYQTFKYVPLLCSRNLVVFGEKHQEDFTYYRRFKEKVDELSTWLKNAKSSLVSKRLRETDEVFCGEGQKMNARGCKFKLQMNEQLNKVASLFGQHLDTKEDQWGQLYNIFKQFEGDGGVGGGNGEWQSNVQEWKSRFPYHSFINKNDAIDASQSPNAHERIVVCFGKRVASEMHRRPSGQHLLTDQNNIGCHGWWDEDHGADMLQRLATLWRPPTCQLADMTYTMKREILTMFARMNMRLFDALPTMLTDEFLKDQGKYEAHVLGPGAYDPQHVTIGDHQYVEEMRVSLNQDEFREPPECFSDFLDKMKKANHSSVCLILQRGSIGTVKVEDSRLKVVWDKDEDKKPIEMQPEQLKIMPHRWKSPKGVMGHMKDLVAGVGQLTDKASEIFGSMFSNRYTNLATMMSGSVSKWVVCPVKSGVNLQKLDSHLGVEDAAFQDFQKEAYAKLTKFKAKVPGEECEKPSFLTDIKFSKAEMCEISVLHADHVEKYTYLEDTPLGDVKKGELEPFVCPMKPSLPADEQLEILRMKKGKCYLHMSEEQLRHYSWLYQGKFPARRQHDRKANNPQGEYELLKVVKVSTGADSETSFGRFCTVDELATTPRFCDPPELYNPWMNLEEMAQSLEEAAAGALGIGSSAISGAISLYQSGLKNRSAKENALMLSEKAWDGLTGAGRLLKSSVDAAGSEIADRLPGDGRRAEELQRKHFRTIESGLGLHSLSFQRSIGKNNRTSNAKERFQRYVVTVPCHGYDPVIRYQIDKKWGDGALRMLKEAYGRAKEILNANRDVELLLRGEAKLFEKSNEHTANSHYYVYQAGMQWPKQDGAEDHKVKVKCTGNKFTGCKPAHQCVPQWLGCTPRTEWSPSNWWAVSDLKLATYVGGRPLSSGDMDLGKLYGIRMHLYCGEKTSFKKTGGSETRDKSFSDCLHRGVRENAKLRALYPWKVYFPEEVVVVATFENIIGRRCNPAAGIPAELREMLCAQNATSVDNEDIHVHKESVWGGKYRGLHTGSGFARGTPSEVVMRPEDVLDALGLMK